MPESVRDAVFQACDAILFESRRIPTYEAIRKALGDTGSNSTISRYRGEWEQQLAERIRHAGQHPEVPESVWSAANEVWDAAHAAATKLAEAALAAKVAEADARVDAATEKARVAEANSEEADRRVEAEDARARAAEAKLAESQSQLAGMRDAITRLTSELTAMTDNRDTLLEERNQAIRKAESVAGEALKERQALVAGHEKDTARWQQDVDAARTDAKSTKATMAQMQGDLHGLERRHDQCEPALIAVQRQLKEALAAGDEMKQKSDGLTAALDENRDALAAVREELAASRAGMTTLQSQLDAANDRIERMAASRRKPTAKKGKDQ